MPSNYRAYNYSLRGMVSYTMDITFTNLTPPCSGIFKYIMSFVASKFHPSLALCLITSTLYDFHVSRKDFVVALERHLAGSDVGSHAYVNVFQMRGLLTFIWGTDTSRPFGVNQATACPNCGYIVPWQRRNDIASDPKHIVHLKCRLCKKPGPIQEIPLGLAPIHDQSAQKWYMQFTEFSNGRLAFFH